MESFKEGTTVRMLITFCWDCMVKYGKLISITYDRELLLPGEETYASVIVSGKQITPP